MLDYLDEVVMIGCRIIKVHPFKDGNGRIARAITDMLLAKSENSPNRFYSMSSQIQKNRKSYYRIN